MKSTYLIPLDFIHNSSQLSSLISPSHSSIYIFYMIDSVPTSIKKIYEWFQQKKEQYPNIYLIYQYPKKINWIQDILL